MNLMLMLIIFSPFIFALMIYFLDAKYKNITTIGGSLFLAILSISIWQNYSTPLGIDIPLGFLIVILDFILLGYFLAQGIKRDNKLVSILAFSQILLFVYLLFILPSGNGASDIYVDSLSLIMFLLINIIGGLITIYAVGYIEDESEDRQKQKQFLAIMMAFLGVMNFLVVANNIEWFFFLFEVTTLASYLLIRFREDKISYDNALRALWMNQIGGVSILLFLIGASHLYGTIHFTELYKLDFSTLTLLPISFLAIAALIKGAQIPFDRWLLGAMVAPTPVSAILHSATMVKIAPFMILKLSLIIGGTYLGYAIAVVGGVVFVVASSYALSKDHFKEILAYSTIGLLGLMIMLSSIGTTLSVTAALMLIIFHGIGKALLFLEAGILEKLHHSKRLSELSELLSRSPLNTLLIFLGFVSLALPPFGAFVGKWLAIESLAYISSFSIFYLFMLLSSILGSVILFLLYFRIFGIVLAKRSQNIGFSCEKYKFTYRFSTYILGAMTLFGALAIAPLGEFLFSKVAADILGTLPLLTSLGLSIVLPFTTISFWYILSTLIFMLLPIILYFYHIDGGDRSREYQGGERDSLKFNTYFFDIQNAIGKRADILAITLFVSVVVAGGLS